MDLRGNHAIWTRELGGDDGGPFGVPVFQQLEQRQSGGLVKRCQSEVVNDQQVELVELVEHFDECAFQPAEGDAFDEAVQVEVVRFMAHETCLVSNCACDVAFSATCRPCDEDVFCAVDEGTVRQCGQLAFFQVALRTTSDLVESRIEAEFAEFQIEFCPFEAAVLGLGLRATTPLKQLNKAVP